MLLVTFLVMGLVIAAMAIGVLLGREPIKGSCGGMSALGMETACDICGGDQKKCDEENERIARESADYSDLGYDASRKDV
jgi:hypothetical protein